MSKYIEVIETNRSRNSAYVCWRQDNPYWATNVEVNLDWIESIIGCKFDDGVHPFVTIRYDESY